MSDLNTRIIISARDMATDTFRGISASVQSVTSNVFSLKTALAGVATGLTASSLVQTASGIEKLSISLKTITGSSTMAQASMAWISNFARQTPYQLEQVTNAFKRLASMGFDPTKYLEPLGDVAASMGTSLEQAVEMFTDAATGEFERLKTFGVRAEQIGDQVVFKWMDGGRQMAQSANKTQDDIANALLQVFRRFDGGMKDQMNSLDGMMSNLKDFWTRSENTFMQSGPFQVMKMSLKDFLNYLDSDEGKARVQTWINEAADATLAGFGSMVAGAEQVVTTFNEIKTTIQDIKAEWSSIPPEWRNALLVGGGTYALSKNLKAAVVAGLGAAAYTAAANYREELERATSATEKLETASTGAFGSISTYIDEMRSKLNESYNRVTLLGENIEDAGAAAPALAPVNSSIDGIAASADKATQQIADMASAIASVPSMPSNGNWNDPFFEWDKSGFSGWDGKSNNQVVIQSLVFQGASPVGSVNGVTYYSDADYQAAADAAREAAETASEATQAAAQAAAEQVRNWQEVLGAYQDLAESVGGVSSSKTLLARGFDSILSTVDTAKSYLQALQDRVDELKAGQSGWSGLSSSIASQIQSAQRAGWNADDYIAEYNRMNDQLATLAAGSDDALSVAKDMLDVLTTIQGLQKTSNTAQAQTNASLLSLYGSTDSTVMALTSSGLNPAQSAASYNQIYADLYNKTAAGIAASSSKAPEMYQAFAQFVQSSYLPYMQANNAGAYGTLFGSAVHDIQSLKAAVGDTLISSGAYSSLDQLNRALDGVADTASTAAEASKDLANGLSGTRNSSFDVQAAFQSMTDYSKTSSQYVAGQMTTLLQSINEAVAKIGQQASLQVSAGTAPPPVKTTQYDYGWTFSTETSRPATDFMGRPTGDTWVTGHWTTPHGGNVYDQYLQSAGSHKPSYGYAYEAAEGLIFTGDAMTRIGERYPEVALPLTGPHLERFFEAAGFGRSRSGSGEDAAEVARALFVIANNTRKAAKLLEKWDVVGMPGRGE